MHVSATACVQTVEGKEALSTVGSELAAMFSHVVLPTLQSHYIDTSDPDWRLKYQQDCLNFAKDKLKLPRNQWHRVTLPCFISMDWDTKHTWVRQFVAMPGRSVGARNAVATQAVDLHLGVASTTPAPQASADPASDLLDSLDPSKRQSQLLKAQRLQEQQDVSETRQRSLMEFEEGCGHNLIDIELCKRATMDTDFITILPEQCMPLSKISPDIHSPVEHMVGTLKRAVRKQVLDGSLVDKALWKGRTYQQFVIAAVKAKGSGSAGRKHIRKSVVKQKIICRILAADKGHKFTVKYTFGEPGRKKKTHHEVQGTAGDWIRATKWT